MAVLGWSAPAASSSAAPLKGPGWTIGPNGKLAPDGDLMASPTSGPVRGRTPHRAPNERASGGGGHADRLRQAREGPGG